MSRLGGCAAGKNLNSRKKVQKAQKRVDKASCGMIGEARLGSS
jgi:hypothetical protein